MCTETTYIFLLQPSFVIRINFSLIGSVTYTKLKYEIDFDRQVMDQFYIKKSICVSL